MAERVGFEPTVPLLGGTRDFQSRSFGQLGHLSAIQPTCITAEDTARQSRKFQMSKSKCQVNVKAQDSNKQDRMKNSLSALFAVN
jgi:hypothetical protein